MCPLHHLRFNAILEGFEAIKKINKYGVFKHVKKFNKQRW